jgi:hypothetical protein
VSEALKEQNFYTSERATRRGCPCIIHLIRSPGTIRQSLHADCLMQCKRRQRKRSASAHDERCAAERVANHRELWLQERLPQA